MGPFLWALAFTLSAALLALTPYTAVVGTVAVIAGAWYARCPDCHRHFLATDTASIHVCPQGTLEALHRRNWRWCEPAPSAPR
jgi:hypothetical protein